jgi:hypothetical protein
MMNRIVKLYFFARSLENIEITPAAIPSGTNNRSVTLHDAERQRHFLDLGFHFQIKDGTPSPDDRSCSKLEIRPNIQLFQYKRAFLTRGANSASFCPISWSAALSITLTSKGHPGSCDAGER